jgi:hypothetical protein
MKSLSRLSVVALLAVGFLGARSAAADLGPPKTCKLEGKGCETCSVSAGKEDEACAAEKKSRGLVLTCTSGGASNGEKYYCKPGTTEDTGEGGGGGCHQTPGSPTTASFATVVCGLGFIAAMLRKRRS